MGLDMYLYKAPRYEDYTAQQIGVIESYLGWKGEGEDKNFTLKEWCGVPEEEVEKEAIPFYEKHFTEKYYYWDVEHKYPRYRIFDEVGYWRKANQIHKWFVDNIQDCIDDCGYYEVNKYELEELLRICKIVKENSHLGKGWVHNGDQLSENGWLPIYEEGECIIDPTIASTYLPTQNGFFFGGTEYDKYYLDDIEETIKIITKVLETTDFDKEMIIYVSSW